MPNVCDFLRPNCNLRPQVLVLHAEVSTLSPCDQGAPSLAENYPPFRDDGRRHHKYNHNRHSETLKQTPAGVRGMFGALKKVGDLILVGCKIRPILAALGIGVDCDPKLRRLTICVGGGDLRLSVPVKCGMAREQHIWPVGEATVVWSGDPGLVMCGRLICSRSS